MTCDLRHMGLSAVVRYVLRVRTNLILIAASACGYYFIAGIQTFGIEFARKSYGLGQAPANALLLVVGIGQCSARSRAASPGTSSCADAAPPVECS